MFFFSVEAAGCREKPQEAPEQTHWADVTPTHCFRRSHCGCMSEKETVV